MQFVVSPTNTIGGAICTPAKQNMFVGKLDSNNAGYKQDSTSYYCCQSDLIYVDSRREDGA